jgi:integrase
MSARSSSAVPVQGQSVEAIIIARTHAHGEGAHKALETKRPQKAVGRQRIGEEMAQYPFLSASKEYLKRRKGILVDSTIKELDRKFRMIDGILNQLKKGGNISTTDPKRITRADVQAFLYWMRTRKPEPLDPSAQNNYLRYLEMVCTFAGNPVVQGLRAEGERLPIPTPKDVRALSLEELGRLQEAAEEFEGWTGEIARFMVWFLPYTGVRHNEWRTAQVEDLNTGSWKFRVRHPKGEMRYGKKRETVVLPPARQAVLRYLIARERYLKEAGISGAAPLVLKIRGGKAGYYSENRLRIIKTKLEKASGVRFTIKDFRSTFTNLCLDRDSSLLSDVSRALGHKDTRTTEAYYVKINVGAALGRLEQAFAEADDMPLISGLSSGPKEKGRIIIENRLTG